VVLLDGDVALLALQALRGLLEPCRLAPQARQAEPRRVGHILLVVRECEAATHSISDAGNCMI